MTSFLLSVAIAVILCTVNVVISYNTQENQPKEYIDDNDLSTAILSSTPSATIEGCGTLTNMMHKQLTETAKFNKFPISVVCKSDYTSIEVIGDGCQYFKVYDFLGKKIFG